MNAHAYQLTRHDKKERAMVDPENANERTVATEARRKDWVTPRIETADLTDTAAGLGNSFDIGGGGPGSCIS